MTSRSLASTHKITPRRVVQIAQEWEDWDADVLQVTNRQRQEREVRRLLAEAEQLVEDAALVFTNAIRSKHVPLQIGSLRQRREALVFQATVQQAAGVLPRNVAGPAELARMQEIVRAVTEILRDPRVPQELLEQMLALGDEQPAIEAVPSPAAA